jgi:hypothetical protein
MMGADMISTISIASRPRSSACVVSIGQLSVVSCQFSVCQFSGWNDK